MTEDVGVTHVEGLQVAFPIGTDVAYDDVREVIAYLEERAVREAAAEQFIEQSRAMRRDMEQRKRARERIAGAGYDRDEIPL